MPKKINLKHVESKKRKVEISEADKEILEKYAGTSEKITSPDEKTVLEIIIKRKTVEMITREINLALKPLGKELMTSNAVLKILNELKNRELVKSVTGADGNEYWVDINYYREKRLGTDRL